MIKIALFCNAGMSTSMLVEKMRKAAEENGQKIIIDAYPEASLAKELDGLDVVLLGPQIKYALAKIQAMCKPKGIPVEVINTADYGLMNGKKVLEQALKLIGK
ncbi:MAG: sugar transporter subunit [Firmicutes bacterium]|nr:sugar transporter subunit [Bacillota bacterium]